MGKKIDLNTMIHIVSLKHDRNLKNREIADKVGFDAATVSRVLKTYSIVKNRDIETYKATNEGLRKNLESQIIKWCSHFDEDPNIFIGLPVSAPPDPEPEEPEQMSFDDFAVDLNSGAEKLLKQILHFVINVDKTLTALAKDERIIKALEVIANEK